MCISPVYFGLVCVMCGKHYNRVKIPLWDQQSLRLLRAIRDSDHHPHIQIETWKSKRVQTRILVTTRKETPEIRFDKDSLCMKYYKFTVRLRQVSDEV